MVRRIYILFYFSILIGNSLPLSLRGQYPQVPHGNVNPLLYKLPPILEKRIEILQDQRSNRPMSTKQYYTLYENVLKSLQRENIKGSLSQFTDVHQPQAQQTSSLASFLNNHLSTSHFEDNIDKITNHPNNNGQLSLLDHLLNEKPNAANEGLDLSTYEPSHTNDYADIPYIPAIHGPQSNEQFSGSSLSSLLGLNAINSTVNAETNVNIPRNLTRSTAIFGTNLADCSGQTICSFGLALLATAGTVGAVTVPLLFGIGKKRKRRSIPEKILIPTEKITDIIYDYERFLNIEGNNDDIADSMLNTVDKLFNSTHASNNWKNHQETANIISKRMKKLMSEISTNKREIKDDTVDSSETTTIMLLETTTLPEPKSTLIPPSDKLIEVTIPLEKRKSNLIARNSDPFHPGLFLNPPLTDPDSEMTSRIGQSDWLQAEHKQSDQGPEDPITEKLRSEIHGFFSQISELHQNLNITSNFTASSLPIKDPKEEVLDLLNQYLKDNPDEFVQNNQQNGKKPQRLAIHPSWVDRNSPDVPNNPWKKMSTDQLIKTLMNPIENDKTFAPKLTHNSEMQNYNNQERLINILEKILKNKQQSPVSPLNSDFQTKLLQQAAINQYNRNPSRPIISNVPHSVPASQVRVPISTIQNILHNSLTRQQNLHSILSKLPELVLGTKTSPHKTTKDKMPQFAPTIIQSHQTPSIVSPMAENSSAQKHPLSQMSNASDQSSNLTPEVQKFYGLLCQAILEPDIPLNRVTAYIAEKCLVMRFTGLISPK